MKHKKIKTECQDLFYILWNSKIEDKDEEKKYYNLLQRLLKPINCFVNDLICQRDT